MIGKLQGIVDYIGDGFVILMAGPVGYKVYTPAYLTMKSTVSLWIETIVREDSIRLFGFTSLNSILPFFQENINAKKYLIKKDDINISLTIKYSEEKNFELLIPKKDINHNTQLNIITELTNIKKDI